MSRIPQEFPLDLEQNKVTCQRAYLDADLVVVDTERGSSSKINSAQNVSCSLQQNTFVVNRL